MVKVLHRTKRWAQFGRPRDSNAFVPASGLAAAQTLIPGRNFADASHLPLTGLDFPIAYSASKVRK